MRRILRGAFRAASFGCFALLAALPVAAQLGASAQIVDTRIPGRWGGSEGPWTATVILGERGIISGTVTGPDFSDCRFAGSIPPRSAFQNIEGSFLGIGSARMAGCTVAAHDKDYAVLLGATPQSLSLSFIDPADADGDAQLFSIEGMTRTVATSRSDTMLDSRIPGHWHGTTGGFTATIDLDATGRMTGSVSGPGMSGCRFAGLVPPALAVLNQEGFFVAAGPEVMVGCADATLNVTYIAYVEATPDSLLLRFISGLPDGRGAFTVKGMVRVAADAREAKAGMWQSPGENGWGVSVVIGDTSARAAFVVLFVYSGTSPTWYVMPGGDWTNDNRFEGDLYVTTGSDWRLPVFTPGTVTKVGRLSMTFSSDDDGKLDYTITDSTGPHAVSKTVTKQQF